MKYKLKLTAAALAAVILLTGCGNKSGTPSSDTGSSSADTTVPTADDTSSAPEAGSSAADSTTSSSNTTASAPQTETTPAEATAEVPPVEAPWDPEIPQRQEIIDSGSVIGVAYIGYVDYDRDSAGCREVFAESEYAQKFPELTTIPDENIVLNEGTELYLIIPGSTDYKSSVNRWEIDFKSSVNRWEIDFENDFAEIIGEELFSTDCGAPFLLKCNVSEIISNAVIKLTDSSGNSYQWCPSISLRDGTVAIDQEQMPAYDLTNYPFEVEENR